MISINSSQENLRMKNSVLEKFPIFHEKVELKLDVKHKRIELIIQKLIGKPWINLVLKEDIRIRGWSVLQFSNFIESFLDKIDGVLINRID